MAETKYIDIHTHKSAGRSDVIELLNHFAGDDCSVILPSRIYSVGIHPWFIVENGLNDSFRKLEECLTGENFIALGETGLDRVRGAAFDVQKQVFVRHVELACKYQVPLIIHCVQYLHEITGILREMKVDVPLIFHRFNGNVQNIDDLLKFDSYFSVGFERLSNENQLKQLLNIPLDRLFIETDAAEGDITALYDKIGDVFGIGGIELATITLQNFDKCFPMQATL